MVSDLPGRYRVEMFPTAEEELAALPGKIRGQVAWRIDKLAEDPRPAGFKELRGLPGVLRIRSGDYRVLYRVNEERLVVIVEKVGHRREVYR